MPDWKGADTGDFDDTVPQVLPKVASIGFESAGVFAGSSILGVVTIDRPAPAGGQLVTLSTNKPGRVILPLGVRIPQGESDASFEIRTLATGVVETVIVTASTADSQASSTLILEAPSLVSFEAIKAKLLSGETTSAVLRLGSAAEAGGTTITLSVDVENVVSLPSTVRIPAGQVQTVIRIRALAVGTSRNVTIRAVVGGVARSIEIEVVSTLTIVDANGDGVVDTADLGMLIGAFGSNNPALDFNGDGVVDTADLGLLNAHFGESFEIDDDDGGDDDPGDTPGGDSDDPVLARWIDIPLEDCDRVEFIGTRTADLFIGFLDEDVVPVITSNSEHGITVSNGEFIQHPFGSNNPIPDAGVPLFPCLKFDSFLSIGDAAPVFLGFVDPTDWGTTLTAIWFSTNGTSEQDPAKFGDNRHYIRIGRFTSQSEASIAGALRVDFAGDLSIVDIPNWSTSMAIALDLNFDGQVDSTDVAMVIRAYGTANLEYDFDGNGVIDGDDLRPLLDLIQSVTGS